MNNEPFERDEAEDAIEQLLIKKNGRRKTANDVFEVLVAMHHSSKKRDALIAAALNEHVRNAVHYTPEQFDEILQTFGKNLGHELEASLCGPEGAIGKIEDEVDAMRARCEERALRFRSSNGGNNSDRQEWYQVLFAWRVLRWFAAAAILLALDIIAQKIT